MQFVAGPDHPQPGHVYPAIVLKAHSDATGKLVVLSEAGLFVVEQAKVTDEPTRGAIFWPDLSPDAKDVDFVGEEVDEEAEDDGEVEELVDDEVELEVGGAPATIPPPATSDASPSSTLPVEGSPQPIIVPDEPVVAAIVPAAVIDPNTE